MIEKYKHVGHSGSCSKVSFVKICQRIPSKVASEHPLLPPPAARCWKGSIAYCAVPDVLFQITHIPEPSYIDAMVDTAVFPTAVNLWKSK